MIPAVAVTERDDSWFCVRALPKHEHIAAAGLRQMPGVDVFLPRLRFRRATRRGAVWVTEALFPCYLFARFNADEWLRRVRAVNGVRGLVQFSDQLARVPASVINDLLHHTGDQELCVIPDEVKVGEEVQITGGVFHGLRAVVTQVIPSRQRVKVLLDFLGRSTETELARVDVVRENFNPLMAPRS